MNRRKFLQGLLSSAAVVVTPPIGVFTTTRSFEYIPLPNEAEVFGRMRMNYIIQSYNADMMRLALSQIGKEDPYEWMA